MSESMDQSALIAQLTELTGLEPRVATSYLSENEWDVNAAAADYFAKLEDAGKDGEPSDTETDDDVGQPGLPAGGHVLGDGPSAPVPATTTGQSASDAPAPPQPRKKMMTMGDLAGSSTGPGGGGGGHSHSDDDDSDGANDQDFFAGGEKSGLAVQNPDDLKRKILERARKAMPRPGGDDPAAPSQRRSNFTGTARTLGGDNTPSEVIEDPRANTRAQASARPERVERRLHFWRDGFSVDDGPLYRSADPQNAHVLALIRQGRAPLAIMNVRQDQEVDVKVEEHDGNYVAPKKQYKPFGGQGQRLGSPVPGVEGDDATATTPAAAPATATATAADGDAAAGAPKVEVDDAQPTVLLQIRLGDGTRLVSRFNTTHTVGDIYGFVTAASPSSSARNWTLMTTFPSKPLEDRSAVLGNMSELKKGGTVVQKWT